MYTELKQYQIIIALLKKYGIKHCVLSAGSRNVPFVHSVEQDPFFSCYSVVDERSAGYFALGLSQQIQQPVVISCTSSTATCNYWPAVTEAFYQRVPLVVLTSDRNPAMLGQWEDQMIDQVGMYDRHVKKSVNLPQVETQDDFIFCQRLVNEALLELNHHGTGPVHINVPTKSYNRSFTCTQLPEVTKIERLDLLSKADEWQEKVNKLAHCKRILVTCGQNSYVSHELKEALEHFFQIFNSSISVEYMSNIEGKGVLNSSVFLDSRFLAKHQFEELCPDIVISFGGNIMSGVKTSLRQCAGKYEHWLIDEGGKVIDLYKSITTIFECSPLYFFRYFCEHARAGQRNDQVYHALLTKRFNNIRLPQFPYSNIYAVQKLAGKIPSGSILHLSINNAIRLTNFFQLPDNIRVYANIGTHGIDGCLSSFLGQACVHSGPAYLIIGDLAFFYDMNALRLRHIRNNVHILLLNNHGGEEFYFNKIWQPPTGDLHTSARHSTKAEGWVNENNFIYLSAHDKSSFDQAFSTFIKPNLEKPVLLEVFTEMKTDAALIDDFYEQNRPKDLKSEILKHGKEFAKSVIGQERAQKILNFIKK